jgi:hypothetical protein
VIGGKTDKADDEKKQPAEDHNLRQNEKNKFKTVCKLK